MINIICRGAEAIFLVPTLLRGNAYRVSKWARGNEKNVLVLVNVHVTEIESGKRSLGIKFV